LGIGYSRISGKFNWVILMANEILEMAKREAEQLRVELSKNITYQKLQIVQRFIDGYETIAASRPKALVQSVPQQYVTPTRNDTKLGKVERVVLDYLWAKGVRMSSGQLLVLLTEKGIQLGGKVPSKTLASMLSNSSRLNNLKGYGYGPMEWDDRPNSTGQMNEAPTESSESASKPEIKEATNFDDLLS
jgi:hypothetical protein